MIENDRQYQVSKEKAAKLEQILLNFPDPSRRPHIHPRLQEAERHSIEDLLDRVNRELTEYEAIIDGTRSVIFVRSLDELPSALGKAREMAGLSVKEVARSVGIPEHELHELERTQFEKARYSLILNVARVLNVSVNDAIMLGVPVSPEWLATYSGSLKARSSVRRR